MKKRTALSACRAALMPALLLCALSGPSLAKDFTSAGVGTASGQFLKIAAGARGAGLGEAYSALADDAFALDWNPAGLINVKKNSLVLMHSPYLAETYSDYLAYGENAGEVGAWGFAAKYMNYGEISETDTSGLELSKFTPYDLAVSVGFACYVSAFNKEPEDRFVLGATGKFVRTKITSEDNTVSADIGLLTPLMFDGNFRMALTAQNIMGTLRLDKENSPLPLIVRLGSLTKLSGFVNLTADVIAVRDNLPYLAMGLEGRIPVHGDLDVFLRGGGNTRAVNDVAGSRNFSLGTGLRYTKYQLDYAFSPFGDLGTVHRISLSMSL